MPGRDKTGPEGMGSLTGRHLGNCSGAGSSVNNYFAGFGRGFNRGFSGLGGFRKGNRFGFGRKYAFVDDKSIQENSSTRVLEDEIKSLKKKLSLLEDQLAGMNDA